MPDCGRTDNPSVRASKPCEVADELLLMVRFYLAQPQQHSQARPLGFVLNFFVPDQRAPGDSQLACQLALGPSQCSTQDTKTVVARCRCQILHEFCPEVRVVLLRRC